MANNFLEQLAAEWYEYQGYFVRRNVRVGKLAAGGYECELDVVAFNPETKHLVHIEPSMDADSWSIREQRFKKKFDAGRRHIPKLFRGFELPSRIEQMAVLGFAGRTRATVGGGTVVLVADLLREIIQHIHGTSLTYSAIPEQFTILRTLQLVSDYAEDVVPVLMPEKPSGASEP